MSNSSVEVPANPPVEAEPVEETETEEETESTEISESEYDFDDENRTIVRAKWIYDGAENIDQMIERLYARIEILQQMKEEGWEVEEPVDDDYAFMKRKKSPPSPASATELNP
jgi:hypothetical protein